MRLRRTTVFHSSASAQSNVAAMRMEVNIIPDVWKPSRPVDDSTTHEDERH
jgi:hypothetical protein